MTVTLYPNRTVLLPYSFIFLLLGGACLSHVVRAFESGGGLSEALIPACLGVPCSALGLRGFYLIVFRIFTLRVDDEGVEARGIFKHLPKTPWSCVCNFDVGSISNGRYGPSSAEGQVSIRLRRRPNSRREFDFSIISQLVGRPFAYEIRKLLEHPQVLSLATEKFHNHTDDSGDRLKRILVRTFLIMLFSVICLVWSLSYLAHR